MFSVLSAVDEIEDNLYYSSDVVSAGIPDVGRLITDNTLKMLIFPLILPSLRSVEVNEIKISPATSLYLLCCILRIVKIKDLANTIAAALLCSSEIFHGEPEGKVNGHVEHHGLVYENHTADDEKLSSVVSVADEQASLPSVSGSSGSQSVSFANEQASLPSISGDSGLQSETDTPLYNFSGSCLMRDTLLSYISSGDDIHVSGSLSLLATLLQTKELDESMLDALGILPQRKQHKKLLLQALVGEESGEEKLFSLRSNVTRNSFKNGLENGFQKLKAHYGRFCASTAFSSSLTLSTYQDGGWLLRQLLPYSEAEFDRNHIKQLNDSLQKCANQILKEAREPQIPGLIS